MTKCDRCGNETIMSTMSFFNEDTICPDCEEKEKAHPEYNRAREVELAECKKGNFNFKGIGKPNDL